MTAQHDNDRLFGERREWRNPAARGHRSTADLISARQKRLASLAGHAFDSMSRDREVAKSYLSNADPGLRYVALSLLADNWEPHTDIATTCRAMADSDPDPEVRAAAIRMLGNLYAGTNTADIKKQLAFIVRREADSPFVRGIAYYSLFKVIGRLYQSPSITVVPHQSEDLIDWRIIALILDDPAQFPEKETSDRSHGSTQWNPFLSSAAYIKGAGAFEKGAYLEAIAFFSESLRHVPRSPLTLHMRGCAHGNLGDLDAAIADFTAVIQMNPKYAIAYYERAEAYRRKGMHEQAAADALRAVELDPSLADDERPG